MSHDPADEPDPCPCGETDCACAEDYENEKGDWLYEQHREERDEK